MVAHCQSILASGNLSKLTHSTTNESRSEIVDRHFHRIDSLDLFVATMSSEATAESSLKPWYRRPAVIASGVLLILVILSVVLGVTLGGGSTDSTAKKNTGATSSGEDVAPSPTLPASDALDSSLRPSASPTSLFGPSLAPPSTLTPSAVSPSLPVSLAPSGSPSTTTTTAPGEIVLGETSNNVPYYCCSSGGSDDGKTIVLLHGGSFSKEIWISTGILEQFCARTRVTVALDWWSGANHQDLMDTLEALQQDSLLEELLILVTPSASGFSMIDWMINGNVTLLGNYLSTWVPVATGSLPLATDEEVASILGIVSVLAINGNDDMAGGRYSARLEELAGATVVELVGGHAVYLQSPDDFVETILELG
jgi:pimeloyl-ACP methyl ester carboxylesterase